MSRLSSRTVPTRIAALVAVALLSTASTTQPSDSRFDATIQVKGSDTIGGSLGPALARAYMARHPEVVVRWEALGSGTAFVGLFDGSAQIGASSRSIKSSELEEATRLGLRLREFVLGYDGISILVHPDNSVPQFTMEEISLIFQGRIDNWNELGGPDLAIEVISRPSYSGTYGFFEEHVLKLGDKDGPQRFAPSTRYIEHSEDIVDEVARRRGAVSYLGMGWNLPSVRAVPVRAVGGTAATPSFEGVRNGTYPIFRELRLYTGPSVRPATHRFLEFVLGESQRIVRDNGFIPADLPEQLAGLAVDSAPERANGLIERIYFPQGGARLDPLARDKIAASARRLRSTEGTIELVGHADSTGSAAINARVTRRRAQVVADELVRSGIPRARIRVTVAASDQPIATNETAAGRARSRRVDIRLNVGS